MGKQDIALNEDFSQKVLEHVYENNGARRRAENARQDKDDQWREPQRGGGKAGVKGTGGGS